MQVTLGKYNFHNNTGVDRSQNKILIRSHCAIWPDTFLFSTSYGHLWHKHGWDGWCVWHQRQGSITILFWKSLHCTEPFLSATTMMEAQKPLRNSLLCSTCLELLSPLEHVWEMSSEVLIRVVKWDLHTCIMHLLISERCPTLMFFRLSLHALSCGAPFSKLPPKSVMFASSL